MKAIHGRVVPFRRSIETGLLLILITMTHTAAFGQAAEVSLERLAESSSDVVLGSVSGKQSFWDTNRTRIFTEVRLKVLERVKGDAPEETIVIVPGGQVGNTLYEVSDMPVFVEGEEVFVFLWREPSGRHAVTGAANGKLHVTRDRLGERIVDAGADQLLRSDPERAGAPRNEVLQEAERTRRVPLDELIRAVKGLER